VSVEQLEPLCAKGGTQVDWSFKHELPAFQTTQRRYVNGLTCHIVDMVQARATRGLSPAITSSSFVEAGHNHQADVAEPARRWQAAGV
jgi:hypothetical protein